VRTLLRGGLLGLGAAEAVLGLWTALFPAAFYDRVPTIDWNPPFSEHLFRDFGGASLGLAVVLVAAGIRPERRLVVVALLAYLAFAAPHLVFHLGHLDGHAGPAAGVLVALLGASVVVPCVLLAVALAGPDPWPVHRQG
jgi:hypothetical protein